MRKLDAWAQKRLNALITKRILLEVAVMAAALICLMVAVWVGRLSTVSARVRADTLRLHVVANSDSQADQDLKLQVRDAVVAEADALFAGQTSESAARAKAADNLNSLEGAARRAVAAAGKQQNVRVRLVHMRFPATEYADFSLPAGEYDAVRVELGRAAGHNWFCVLYPALCLPSAEPAAYPDTAETALVRGGYEVRFAALDWLESRFA